LVASLSAVVGALRGNAVAGWVEDYEATRTFTRARGLEAGLAEEEMEHAALA
jgi:hypothetical protein